MGFEERRVWNQNTHEELKMPVDSTGNADVLLKGVDVSVLADADKECEVDAVVDDAPWIELGIRPERDTLGSTSPEAVRPAETTGDGVAGSRGRVETLVTTPAESIYCTTATLCTMTTSRSCSSSAGGERM